MRRKKVKKALLKDSIKEIKNTYKRFISILLMAFLGVGFFAGIRAASPAMIETIDQYYKDNEVYDIQVLSTLGLTKQDLEELQKTEGIEKIVGTYETDGKIETENKEVITKVMCVEEINKPILLQGELPKKQEECVVEESFLKANHKKIGDNIELEIEKTKDEEGNEIEYLNQTNLKIVGVVKSPLYISRDRGTSNLGSGKIDYYVYITKENIHANEIYTNLYIQVEEADKYVTSSDNYQKQVDKIKTQIENRKEEREKARHEELVNKATTKVQEAEEELNTQKEEAQEKLQKAKQEIENGKTKIQEAEQKLKTGRKEADVQFEKANQQIQEAKNTIAKSETELATKQQEAEQKFKELEAQKQQLQRQLDNLNDTEETKPIEQNLKAGITQIEKAIEEGKQQLEKGKQELQKDKSELESKEAQYQKKKRTTEQQLETAKKEIEKSKNDLKIGEEELAQNEKEFQEKIQEAEGKLDDAKEDISKIENPKWYILDRTGNAGYNSFIQDTKSVENIAKVFPIVFFLVALLISLTSMTRMVEEQRTQIGTLKALGYRKIQIASKYVIYASLATLMGGILGMGVGFALLPSVIWKMYQMMYQITDKIQLNFHLGIGGIGLALISICIIGATLYSVLKELVNTPANLMRPKAPKMGKRVLLEKIPFIWKHLSFSRKVTVRNIFRYKKRFLMTIIGILGCTSLILVGFGLRDSIQSIMPSQFGKVFQYDMQIALKTSIEEKSKQDAIEKIQQKAEINAILETYMKSSTITYQEREEEVQIIVPKEESQLEGIINLMDSKTGEKVRLKDNEICLTDKVAQLLGVKVGDTLSLKNGNEDVVEVKISNIVENYISHYVYMSKETYENLYKTAYETNVLFTKNQELNEEQEEQLATELMSQNEIATVSRIATTMNMLDDTMKSLNYVVIILIVSAGLLAFVVLYNLSNVNISERIRELATIKVLGFYDKEVHSYVTRETVLLTAIGIVLGLVAGYFLNYFIMGTCEINMLRFKKIVEPMSYVYAILITIVFTLIVNRVTFFALKKIDMIESLKSVE